MPETVDPRHLLEIRTRIDRFYDSLTTPCGSYVSEEVLLRKIELLDRAGAAYREMTMLSDPNESVTLASMPHWLIIPFPRRATDEAGIFGTSVLIEDLLTWTYDGREDEQAKYGLALANALRGDRHPRPDAVDPLRHHHQRLAALIGVMEACEAKTTAFTMDEKLSICIHLRDALETVEHGERSTSAGFLYPVDFLPTADSDNIVTHGMGFDVGWALRKLMDHADYVDEEERRKIRIALDYFPDRDIDLEVSLSGEDFVVFDPAVLDHSAPKHLMLPPAGSVRLDHYGEGSAFSPLPGEYEFALHRPAAHQDVIEEYGDVFFLVSDRLTYTLAYERL